MSRWLLSAIVCGALPLIGGAATFLLWLGTRSGLFEFLGVLILIGGVVLFAVGAVCLILHVASTPTPTVAGRRRLIAQTVLVALFLLANFPAAALILHEVQAIQAEEADSD